MARGPAEQLIAALSAYLRFVLRRPLRTATHAPSGRRQQMDVLVERCAGLDVHRDSVMATVRVPAKRRRQREQQTRGFPSTLGGLQALADWLEGFGVTLVGMEATGIYWRTVFDALEPRFRCWLLNARHLRNVPGRKSDVINSAWICQLVEHGLVRPSFVPPLEIRRLRDLTRLRKTQIEERTRVIQRLEKVLQDAGIKLTSVASQAYSVSARAILEALLAGVTEPAQLAELARGRMRAKIPQLQEALRSRFDLAHHGVLVASLLSQLDSLELSIANLDQRIVHQTEPLAELVELVRTIPGVGLRTGQVLIAECGIDMSIFPSVAPRLLGRHLPGDQQLGGQALLGQDPPRLQVVAAGPQRVGAVGSAHEGHLPRLPLRADPRPPRLALGDRRPP